jgi:hypothetical protein
MIDFTMPTGQTVPALVKPSVESCGMIPGRSPVSVGVGDAMRFARSTMNRRALSADRFPTAKVGMSCPDPSADV